eukprot:29043-Eustigmatos_ZCMA.PRE.1
MNVFTEPIRYHRCFSVTTAELYHKEVRCRCVCLADLLVFVIGFTTTAGDHVDGCCSVDETD